jgi:hypothetical protein
MGCPLCLCSNSHFPSCRSSSPSSAEATTATAARQALRFLPCGLCALPLRAEHIVGRERSLSLRLLLHSAMSTTRGGAAAAAAAALQASAGQRDSPPPGHHLVDEANNNDESEVPANEVAAARAKKIADATAAAADAAASIVADAKGPHSQLHSSVQVLLLNDSELWDTIVVNWCKPDAEMIVDIVETWEGRDLAACVWKLGLPVLYAKRNYAQHMRRSVVDAVRKYAREHPDLFEQSESESEGERKEVSPTRTPPPARAIVSQAKSSDHGQRRSPRAPASSRSISAAAMAAMNALPVVGRAPVASPSRARASTTAPSAPSPTGGSRARGARPPAVPGGVRLQDVGAALSASSSEGSESEGSDSDHDWMPGNDEGSEISVSLRRGGRLRREDADHHLARAGVHRPFAAGFVANARFAAGGRSMYQLYKEVTSSFSSESSKRECLALSRILDALLRGDTDTALEHTCRRLGGVHTAAETGNWAMCERLETETEQRSFVPDAFMRSALKSVTQMQAVKKSAAENAGGKQGSFRRNAQTSGRGDRSSAKSNKNNNGSSGGRGWNKDKDTTTGASTSHKKKSSAAGSDA